MSGRHGDRRAAAAEALRPTRPEPGRAARAVGIPDQADRPRALPPVPVETLRRAIEEYDRQGRRVDLLSGAMSADPAWNIMLDLLISEAHDQRLSVTAVCIGSRTPTSTALRYIAMLSEADLVERTADRSDRRRSYIRLTGRGLNCMFDIIGPN